MPEQVDKRVEYRVVGDRAGESDLVLVEKISAPEVAEAAAFNPPGWPAYTNVRVQESTVTESRTPWEDVADE